MCQIVHVAAAQVDGQHCRPLHLPSMGVPSARSVQLQSAHRVSVQVKLEGALASSHIERHMRWRGWESVPRRRGQDHQSPWLLSKAVASST